MHCRLRVIVNIVIIKRSRDRYLGHSGGCTSMPQELLLQSDARDALTMRETSPFLIDDRLQLRNVSSTLYVNGGVFFARGTHAVARLFEDAWALVSQD